MKPHLHSAGTNLRLDPNHRSEHDPLTATTRKQSRNRHFHCGLTIREWFRDVRSMSKSQHFDPARPSRNRRLKNASCRLQRRMVRSTSQHGKTGAFRASSYSSQKRILQLQLTMAARQQHPPGALETSYSSQKRSCSCNLQWQHVSNIHQEHLKLPTHRKNAPAVATYNGSTSATSTRST